LCHKNETDGKHIAGGQQKLIELVWDSPISSIKMSEDQAVQAYLMQICKQFLHQKCLLIYEKTTGYCIFRKICTCIFRTCIFSRL